MLNAVYSSQVMRGLTAAERVVYQYLVFRYNDATGQCNCPIKTIADQCGFGDGNRRNVARIVNALIRKGYLSRQTFRYRNGEGYCYIPTENPEVATGVKVTPVDKNDGEDITGVKVTPHGGHGNPKQGSRQPRTGVVVTPSINEPIVETVSGAATAATLTQCEIEKLVGWAAKLLNVKSPRADLWGSYIQKHGKGNFRQQVEEVSAAGLKRGAGQCLDKRLIHYL